MKKTLLFMIPFLMLAACQPKGEKVPALELSNLDTLVAPGDDFYAYATHGWQVNNPLKPEFARFGTFDQLRENNVVRLNDLFASMTTMKTKPGSVDRKIVDLYKQGLDSLRLNEEGAEPMKPYIAELYAVSSKEELASAIGKLHNAAEQAFFGAYVMEDLTNSETQILYLGQAGLGIGDRDYYLLASNLAIKEGYRNFLEKVFSLAGVEGAKAKADNAVFVEEVLARHSWTREQERDIMAQYNPMSTAELEAAYPGFPFAAYFETRGIEPQEKLVVAEPSYFKGFSEYFASADLEVLKDYVAAQLVAGGCGALSDDFYTASFEFYSRQMAGVQEQKPRWKRAMQVPNGILSEAVGKMYVKKYFPESSKRKMLALVKNLQKALGEHIAELEWMSDSTKVRAQEKLAAFTVKIGYPDKWKDYSTLDIDPSKSYYENLKAAGEWYIADNLSKLGKPTDKTEWGMSPQTVNAYYNPTSNEICFPAAILQPPFFNPDADDAINYGAIGVVIGHEMTHGFDDQGRLFDAKGNMSDWWTAEDAAKFNEKAEGLVKQYSAVEILPGVYANGQNTLGENIADHGGLSIAYSALHNAIKGKKVGLIDGFTPDQRFYLGYATVWAQNITPEEMARLTNLDVHSLGENRVNVAVRNFQTFFDAFGITEGAPMWRPEEERVHIW
ncbi:MAG: M13 family metallopeptidase [Bacteroidales bacterium]|nr:M13 family metallopeptidase [Bacteroidales bacterium]